MTDGLDRRTVLVTGGTGALGRHVVRSFVEAGSRVHVPVLDPSEIDAVNDLLGAASDRVKFHPDADLTDPDVVSRVIRASHTSTQQDQGGIRGPDVVLNLAGGFAMAPVEETDPSTWSRMMAMNATTAFLTSRAAFPAMKARGWGRIVNVSAFPAVRGGAASMSAYGAAKAAVLNLTQALAREGASHGITANAILPSIIDTPGNRSAMPDADTSTWIPPQEIAAVCVFLAGGRARVVNGATLTLTLGDG
ncbi:MAG: SDR family oxidoreductase [Gemmatimonadales bacterium]|nr:MAG: SDR family oxidoreductase [Gemmatimonadales bacterium]